MDILNVHAAPQKRNCPFYFLLAACFLIPIIFIPQLYDVFDLPKLVALKTALLCVMFPAFLRSVKKNAVTFSLHAARRRTVLFFVDYFVHADYKHLRHHAASRRGSHTLG